jgi:hypothetical protein
MSHEQYLESFKEINVKKLNDADELELNDEFQKKKS